MYMNPPLEKQIKKHALYYLILNTNDQRAHAIVNFDPHGRLSFENIWVLYISKARGGWETTRFPAPFVNITEKRSYKRIVIIEMKYDNSEGENTTYGL